MELGSELSKTVATFIVQKILLDDVRPGPARCTPCWRPCQRAQTHFHRGVAQPACRFWPLQLSQDAPARSWHALAV